MCRTKLIFLAFGILLSLSHVKCEYNKEFVRTQTIHYNDPSLDEGTLVCEALKSATSDKHEDVFKITPINETFSYEDVLKLSVWNMKRGFKYRTTENQLNFPNENWRRLVLDDIFAIFVQGCANDYVPHAFLNVMYEILMIYYQNAPTKIKENNERWKVTADILERCKAELPNKMDTYLLPITVDSIYLFRYHSVPPGEVADENPDLDLVVDTLWWVFSFSFASCYNSASYRSVWAPRFMKIFYEDFLEPLMPRWNNAGPKAAWGVMIGNIDLDHVLINMRSCTTDAYKRYGLRDRQLVRPVMIAPEAMNYKTGEGFRQKFSFNDINYI